MALDLTAIKHALRVTDDADDALLERLFASAVAEFLQFTELDTVPDAPDAENGIVLMIQADYDGDPERRTNFREAAHQLWLPHRQAMGV